MWNAIQYEDSSTSYWTWEGNAESMQLRALRALHLIKTAQFEKINQGYRAKCIATLGEKPLSEAIQLMLNWPNDDQPNPYLRVHYDCGAYLENLAEKIMKASGGELFDLWKSLYEDSNKVGRRYSATAYFRNLSKLSNRTEATEILRGFSTTPGAELLSLEKQIDELLK
ncbi:MAG: hypothetical protein K2Q26_04620 [Bdellovibrionales bacterium]|nr:hypothetical protein [Bdellovibrionales bacterium]